MKRLEYRERLSINAYRNMKCNLIAIPLEYYQCDIKKTLIMLAMVSYMPDFFKEEPYFVPALNLKGIWMVNDRRAISGINNAKSFFQEAGIV